jgi:hypothetical protein
MITVFHFFLHLYAYRNDYNLAIDFVIASAFWGRAIAYEKQNDNEMAKAETKIPARRGRGLPAPRT